MHEKRNSSPKSTGLKLFNEERERERKKGKTGCVSVSVNSLSSFGCWAAYSLSFNGTFFSLPSSFWAFIISIDEKIFISSRVFGWFFFFHLTSLRYDQECNASPHREAIKWKRCSHVWKKYLMPVDFDWTKWRNWFVLTPMLENLLIFQVTSENTIGMFLILFHLIIVQAEQVYGVHCTQYKDEKWRKRNLGTQFNDSDSEQWTRKQIKSKHQTNTKNQ